MSYTMNPSDVWNFASYLGISVKEHGDELAFKECPSCHGGDNGDTYTFCINTRTGAANCVRQKCGYKGHFVEVCRDFDYKLDYETAREYKTLPQPPKAIVPTEPAIEYLKTRGISKTTAERFEITSHNQDKKILVFPFFNEQGELKFIKYRNTKFKKGDKGNKEWCEKDTMPILFGMKQCVSFDRLIITEGQLDSLSVAEAGFENAVSVPTGASGFTWFMPCKEWFDKFKEIIVFGDYENGKITLVDGIKARTDKTVKVVRKIDYLGEKDANDILRKYGKSAIVNCINRAEVPKLENVKELCSVRAVDINKLSRIPTGFPSLDRAINGIVYSTLTLVTGKRGEGKSTLMSQLVCSALENGESIFVYSGELADYQFKAWLDYQLAGRERLDVSTNKFGDEIGTIPECVTERLNAWYKGRAYIYDNTYVAEKAENILETVERVIRDYGVTLVCLDNLMTVMEVANSSDTLYVAQSNFVGALKKLAMKYDVAIILVAHTKKGSTVGEFDNDSISGASEIANKADVILHYGTIKHSEGDENTADSLLQIAKNRMFGKKLLGAENGIKLFYSPLTKRICEEGVSYHYSWNKDELNYKPTEWEELPF